jgi:ABC-type dipeptide/oligopeptide/nickel transport system permease subunit
MSQEAASPGGVITVVETRRDAVSAAAWWRRHRLGIFGATLVSIVVVASVVGPLLLRIDPNLQDLTQRLLLPLSYSDKGIFHWLGSDELGRDVLARLFAGGRA